MRMITSLNLEVSLLEQLDVYLDGEISRSSAVNILIRKFLDNPVGLI